MEERIFKNDGRKFVVKVDGDTAFIGTVGLLSNIAAQIISHEMMAPLNWKPTKTFKDMWINNIRCTAVGYQIPYTDRLFKDPMQLIAAQFNNK